MKRIIVMFTIALVGIAVGIIGNQILAAEQKPFKRTVLLKTDLTKIAGTEAVVLTVEGAPGVVVKKHYHPGDEFILRSARVTSIP